MNASLCEIMPPPAMLHLTCTPINACQVYLTSNRGVPRGLKSRATIDSGAETTEMIGAMSTRPRGRSRVFAGQILLSSPLEHNRFHREVLHVQKNLAAWGMDPSDANNNNDAGAQKNLDLTQDEKSLPVGAIPERFSTRESRIFLLRARVKMATPEREELRLDLLHPTSEDFLDGNITSHFWE